ncbi:MAG: D-alanyl-D-alanine carboxypeptidase/D-alanyl-D-alanine-endopeptidase, partial [Acidobacteriota bacterium]
MKIKASVISLLLAGALSLCGCAARSAATVAPPVAPADTLEHLREDLDRIFSDPAFAGAQWGVEVLSLDRGDVLYARNSTSLYMPASNNKVLTAAAALVRLGPDFRYQTAVSTDGEIVDGVLHGSLVIAGTGDPSAAARFHEDDPFRVFREWTRRIKESGVTGIHGALIADGRAFSEPSIGSGWEWDDLPFGYAAPVTALQFNENLLTIEVAPAEKEGDAALVRCSPLAECVSIESTALTAAASSRARLTIQRGDVPDSLVVSGSVPAGSAAHSRTVAIPNPARCFLLAFRKALEEEGIDVSRATVGPVIAAGGPEPAETRLLF